MVEQKDGQAEVDFCVACGGVWFDKGEIEAEGGRLPDDLTVIPSATPRTCPRCVAPLGTVRAPSVEIDLCATCGGVYLDRDELDRLRDLKRNAEVDAGGSVVADAAKEAGQAVGMGVIGLLLDALGSLL
jgi:Zn-finger nucleic acid-binding protein